MREAAAAGAQLLVTPENSNRVRDYRDAKSASSKSEALDGDVRHRRAAPPRRSSASWSPSASTSAARHAPDVYIASVLIDSTGEILHVHHKTVFWDYEYTLFTPGTKQLEVVDTRIGRVGLLLCADGIVPEVPRILALKGAEILRQLAQLPRPR